MTSDANNPTPAAAPAAGWFPDPRDVAQLRYWDGQTWTEHTAPAQPQMHPIQPQVQSPAETEPTPRRAKPKKGWIIGGSVAAGVLLIGAIGAAAGAGAGTVSGSGSDKSTVAAESAQKKIAVPDVVGMTVADAKAALTKVGFTIVSTNDDTDIVTTQSATELVEGGAIILQSESADVPVPNVVGKTAAEAVSALQAAGLDGTYDGEGSALVTAQGTAAGATAKRGTVVTLTLQPPMTLAQENAIQSAQSYLDNLGGFSKKALISQLKYEKFSKADAQFAVEHVVVDWNEQAAQSAESYMDMGGFSKGELRDQLAYEGFSKAQISFALKSVGY